MGSKLRNKVNRWVWEYLEGLTLDEPKVTQWFVDALHEHWESIKGSRRHISNRYWDCSPQGVSPILRQAGYRVVGICRSSNQSLWSKQSS